MARTLDQYVQAELGSLLSRLLQATQTIERLEEDLRAAQSAQVLGQVARDAQAVATSRKKRRA